MTYGLAPKYPNIVYRSVRSMEASVFMCGSGVGLNEPWVSAVGLSGLGELLLFFTLWLKFW